jgi:membrane-associated protease RseP (regulator of RpoE activity)
MSRGERLGVVVFSVGLLGLLTAELLDDFEPRKLSVLFIAGLWAPLLVVHELGHALVARLVGWHVHEIVIGFGPELVRFRALGANATVRLIPVEGYVVPSPDSLRGARGKSALIYFAGPAAELVCALLALFVMGPAAMLSHRDDMEFIAGLSF